MSQRAIKAVIVKIELELSEADYLLSQLRRDLADAQLARERLVVALLNAKKELSKER